MIKAPLKFSRKVGEAYADHLFEDFQKPGFRGSNFRWSEFPNLVGGMAKSGVAMSIYESTRNKSSYG
jgi:hypothetical protein